MTDTVLAFFSIRPESHRDQHKLSITQAGSPPFICRHHSGNKTDVKKNKSKSRLTCQGSPCPQLHRYQAEDFPFQTGHFHCKRINYFKLA